MIASVFWCVENCGESQGNVRVVFAEGRAPISDHLIMITIERAVFQQLAAQVHAGLPGVAAQISENNKIQVIEAGRVVEEFSTAEDFCNALLRGEQVPVPAQADCEKMAKNAGIKKPAKTPSTESGEKGKA